MITLKSEHEIKLMKVACNVVARLHQELKKRIKPKVTTKELDAFAHRFILDNDCEPTFLNYHGFPATICISVNDQLIHGIPSDYQIKDGDLVSIDVGCKYKGYHADAAFSVGVGKVSDEVKQILKVTEMALYKGIETVKHNARVGDIGAAIQQYVESCGYHLTEMFTGHGIGTNLHEEPQIPNTGKKGTGVRLQKNMTICIEPMVITSTPETYIDPKDHWTVYSKDHSLTCHFEHQILITEDGYEILTKL